ncbi:MAG: FAD:protein FMN transferase [Lachnospiraceae bacterium]|nr:FAD:protein FMN transferase [Lachnospiraceae bacterium]
MKLYTQYSGNSITCQAMLMSTLIAITVYSQTDAKYLPDCFSLIERQEQLLSRFLPGSEISRINHRAPETERWQMSEDTAAIISRALYYSELSGGLFDITTEPLSRLWNVNGENPVIPTAASIQEALRPVGFHYLHIPPDEPKTLCFLSPDVQIDLGGIAKGYIADKVRDFLSLKGVKNALINLGGNLICHGKRPDGSPFRVGIQDPFSSQGTNRLILHAEDLSVVTSGSYERHFIRNGKNYHHIIDPRSGYPRETDALSVTILSHDSIDDDGLSTVCFALGSGEGCALLDTLDNVCGIFITNQNKLILSNGAEDFIISQTV